MSYFTPVISAVVAAVCLGCWRSATPGDGAVNDGGSDATVVEDVIDAASSEPSLCPGDIGVLIDANTDVPAPDVAPANTICSIFPLRPFPADGGMLVDGTYVLYALSVYDPTNMCAGLAATALSGYVTVTGNVLLFVVKDSLMPTQSSEWTITVDGIDFVMENAADPTIRTCGQILVTGNIAGGVTLQLKGGMGPACGDERIESSNAALAFTTMPTH